MTKGQADSFNNRFATMMAQNHELTAPEIAEFLKDYKEIFFLRDADHNSRIDMIEMAKCLEDLNLAMTRTELRALFKKHDIDFSGTL
eukprot:UC4_evm2s1329